jgi:hypothetical protein
MNRTRYLPSACSRFCSSHCPRSVIVLSLPLLDHVRSWAASPRPRLLGRFLVTLSLALPTVGLVPLLLLSSCYPAIVIHLVLYLVRRIFLQIHSAGYPVL